MHILMVLNDPPYGTERTYNGLRLAHNLLRKSEGAKVTVRSEEHTLNSSHSSISYAVFCLKKKRS